jgi:phosphate:Na+ symporter
MLYGLVHLKRAAEPLQASASFAIVTSALSSSYLLAFLTGGLLRLIIQSSSGISVILITLCGRGLLGPELVLMAMAGTGLGIAGSVLLFGRNLQGEGLRIAYWQGLSSVFSSLVMGGWCGLAQLTGLPNAQQLTLPLHLSLETSLALVFLMQMLLYPVAAWLAGHRAPLWLARLAPEAAEVSLARPHYLTEGAVDQPTLALEEVRKEQLRLLKAVPSLLDRARLEGQRPAGRDPALLAESLAALGSEITAFLTEALERDEEAGDTREHLAALQRQQCMDELVSQLSLLAAQAESLPAEGPARQLAATLVDSTDLILHQLLAVMEGGEAIDREMLAAMTQDRGDQMEGLRHRASTGQFGSAREQASVLYAATLFERSVYLIRRLAGC